MLTDRIASNEVERVDVDAALGKVEGELCGSADTGDRHDVRPISLQLTVDGSHHGGGYAGGEDHVGGSRVNDACSLALTSVSHPAPKHTKVGGRREGIPIQADARYLDLIECKEGDGHVEPADVSCVRLDIGGVRTHIEP